MRMEELPANDPLSNMKSSSNLPLHIEHIVPGRLSTPDPEKPIHALKDFPKLQAPYLAALTTSDETDEIHTGRTRRATAPIVLPPGWRSYIHPKGWVYYYHPDLRLVTDYRIEYRLGFQEFEAALREVEGFPIEHLPTRCELWIDYMMSAGRTVAEKLFVDHERRRLTPKAPKRRQNLSPQEEYDQLWQDDDIDVKQQLKYEQAYWEYIIDHPCHAALPSYAEDDAIAALTWYAQDRLINPEDSIVPYSREMSKDLLDLMITANEKKDIFDSPRNSYIKTHLVASVLERTAGERLKQKYGEQDARNYIKKTLKGRNEPPSEPLKMPFGPIVNFIMTFVCFGTPYAYLRHINEKFFASAPGRTDTIIERWQNFVDENVSDWTNTNLVATVLVSASVALLAVPGIDQFTRVLGITSTLFSIASIITGLLNVWQHQHKSRRGVVTGVIFDFFGNAERWVGTDDLLAILLALPMVLLIWSTLLFAVSMVTFAWFGVDETAIEAGRSGNDAGERVEKFGFGRATAWITIGCLSLLTMLVLISFLYFWRIWKPYKPSKKRKL